MSDYLIRWPFEFVVDEHAAPVGWVVVHSRVISASRQAELADLRRHGFRFVGMTSDGMFPFDAAADPIDYGSLCEGWCHCFREPDRYLPPGVRRELISESDFTDWMEVTRAADRGSPPHERVDFVYVGATQSWKRDAKNWDLMCRCLPRLCGELRLRGCVVGSLAGDAPMPS